VGGLEGEGLCMLDLEGEGEELCTSDLELEWEGKASGVGED